MLQCFTITSCHPTQCTSVIPEAQTMPESYPSFNNCNILHVLGFKTTVEKYNVSCARTVLAEH